MNYLCSRKNFNLEAFLTSYLTENRLKYKEYPIKIMILSSGIHYFYPKSTLTSLISESSGSESESITIKRKKERKKLRPKSEK